MADALDKILDCMRRDQEDVPCLNPGASWAVASKLARDLGLRVRKVSFQQRVDWQWPGDGTLYAPNYHDVLHEVAHYLVADPARRRERDFGLGAGPESKKKAPCLMGCSGSAGSCAADHEEELTSLLGILWEAKLGLNYPWTLIEHGWWPSGDSVREVARELSVQGLVRNGSPVIPPGVKWSPIERSRFA